MTPPPLRTRPPVFEAVMAGAGLALMVWAAIYLMWAIGELVSRYGVAIPALVVMMSMGGLGGLWSALNWDRIQ